MSERLSKQLADLSARAKSAKEAIDAAETEASEKLAVRKEEARAAAAAAAEKVGAEIKSARDTADQDWSVVRAKVDADIAALKVRASAVKHNVEVSHLEFRAADFGMGRQHCHRLCRSGDRASQIRRSRCDRGTARCRRCQTGAGLTRTRRFL